MLHPELPKPAPRHFNRTGYDTAPMGISPISVDIHLQLEYKGNRKFISILLYWAINRRFRFHLQLDVVDLPYVPSSEMGGGDEIWPAEILPTCLPAMNDERAGGCNCSSLSISIRPCRHSPA